MNADDVVRWAPRVVVGIVVVAFLWFSLVLATITGRAAAPQGPILAFAIFTVCWGGFAYLLVRRPIVREWLLGRRSL